MILFLISFLLVFISSYLFACFINPKKNSIGIIYLYLIAFAQLVLTFEILSLFTLVKPIWVLAANAAFLLGSIFLWNKKGRNIWKLNFSNFMNRFFNSLKLDKSLLVLFIGYCISFFVSVFLCFIMPTNNGDALDYHLARSLFWILQNKISHFDIADVRNLCLPINSEILYSWVLLFIRKNVFIGFFALVGYLISMISVYNILGLLGYCVRKRLWVIFILTSLPSVLIQCSTSETDVIIAGLVTSCIFLFWYGLKHNEKLPVFFASLAYAIAIGTKTTSLIMIPAVGLFLVVLCFYFKNYKYLKLFLISGCINFLIFSSYNYILNYIQFSNFICAESYMAVNKNYYGIKGALSNFIKHIFMLIDFAGFKWGLYLHPYMKSFQDSVLSSLNLLNLPDYYAQPDLNISLLDTIIGPGVLCFLVYIPCVLRSFFKFKPVFKKPFFLALFGLLFLINLFSLSFTINYSTFDERYIVSFLILSSFVLIYSYNIKFKPFKYLIILFALYSFIFISTNIAMRPFVQIVKFLYKYHSVTSLREHIMLKDSLYFMKKKIQTCFLPNSKILVFLNKSESIYSIKSLELEGYKVDFKQLSHALDIDFDKYDLVLIQDNAQYSYLIKKGVVIKNDSKMISNNPKETKNPDVFCSYVAPTYYITEPCFMKCEVDTNFFTQKNYYQYFDVTVGEVLPEHYYVYVNKKHHPFKKNILK